MPGPTDTTDDAAAPPGLQATLADPSTRPVTVAVTRQADPSHDAEVTAWIRAGSSLAEQFPGFLGVGWIRSGPHGDTWHTLYRFTDPAALDRWEHSAPRRWWLAAAQGIVVDTRVQRRSGIEEWFDGPAARCAADQGRTPPAPPPRWKQTAVIFAVFLPLSLLLGWLSAHAVPQLPLAVRVCLQTTVATPVMVYAGLPWATRRMDWWLHGRPPPWRR